MLTLVLEHVLIPVKETVEDPAATLTILQAYISQLNFNGFVLVADMVFFLQSAACADWFVE
ncbi:hypothetical protein ARMSODRAFT_1019400 [Armillaria solidipes]|uniref:SEC63 domain-containing protein n=1 Tax=Armillaria solidipes TaxID=1076256 RepID=A0A2H3C0J6_9AGAR|nr:hypothetical protein ARMSODRAFT_1019400 [Armillaria solidipes]